jgi:hypothetical protein
VRSAINCRPDARERLKRANGFGERGVEGHAVNKSGEE